MHPPSRRRLASRISTSRSGADFSRRATSDAIVRRLNFQINKILQLPDIKARLEENGAEIRLMTPAELAGFMRAESDKYLRIIKETGVTSE
jgi:tripartite-type tricarboxylate transporter receptor subunit TctC